MKKRTILLISLALLLLAAALVLFFVFREPKAPETILSPDSGEEMRLVWHDEFDDPASLSRIDTRERTDSLDAVKWNLRAKMNQGDIENGRDDHNVAIEKGNLVMRTWKEGEDQYSTNTSVTTDGVMSYRYGYLEMRANVPFRKGCWPSFWMQSKDTRRTADYMTEIDMFEVFGSPNTIESAVHKWYKYDHYSLGGGDFKFETRTDLNKEYHLYGMGWTPEELYFTVDGAIYSRFSLTEDFGIYGDGMGGFQDPIYIIFNNFIFTDGSSWKQPTVTEVTVWPVTYKIDWIRLYQKPGEGEVYSDLGD